MKLHPLLALLALVFTAHAEVLVYAGSFVRSEPEEGFKTEVTKCFVVTNPATGEFVSINYGKIDGVKKRETSGQVDGDLLSGAFGGPNVDLYVFVEREDLAFGRIQTAYFLRGLRKTVQISLMGGVPVFAERAKTLKCSLRRLVVSLAGTYQEATCTVTLDKTRTVDANVASRTYAQVVADLHAFLESRGFVE